MNPCSWSFNWFYMNYLMLSFKLIYFWKNTIIPWKNVISGNREFKKRRKVNYLTKQDHFNYFSKIQWLEEAEYNFQKFCVGVDWVWECIDISFHKQFSTSSESRSRSSSKSSFRWRRNIIRNSFRGNPLDLLLLIIDESISTLFRIKYSGFWGSALISTN